ncbi:MAG TPA: GvpL/GvpF family gas vesicle protein [Terriglobales bacterium]|nr:GvpL/GvpF family gas vesicle protein [Terriglobales bacterium]
MAAKLKPSASVLYLYGVSNARPARPVACVGVDGTSPVETLNTGSLTSWISRVPRPEFADNLARNIENLDWLADASVRHQRVVAAIGEITDILPTRLGTVFLNENSLAADVERRKATLTADLKRIQGKDEYGVKVFAGKPTKVEVPLAARSGKDYLQAKSALLRMRTPQNKKDADIERLAQALDEVAEDTAEGGRISSGRRDLLYNVSVLLKRDNRKQLESLISRFAREWGDTRQIECTGPWPPYSFVSRDI